TRRCSFRMDVPCTVRSPSGPPPTVTAAITASGKAAEHGAGPGNGFDCGASYHIDRATARKAGKKSRTPMRCANRGDGRLGPEVSAIHQVVGANFGAELLRGPPRRPVVVEHEGVAHVTRPATDELEIRVRRHREIHA